MNFLLVIPGYGGKEWKQKSDYINSSINKLKTTAPENSKFTIKIFNYDSSPNNFNFGEFEEKKEPGILGEFIYKYIKPDLVKKFDYVILMLDDIILQDNFNLTKALHILKSNNLDLISPSLTTDSIHSHIETLIDSDYKNNKNKIGRVCNFIEFFLYIIPSTSYEKYYSLFNQNTKWMWGMDFCMDNLLKMCILDNMNMKHCLSSHNSIQMHQIKMNELRDILNKYNHILGKDGRKKYKIYYHIFDKYKILFYGDKGWIGGLFIKYLKQFPCFEIICGKERIENKDNLLNEIQNINPDTIISFTGRTNGYNKNGEKINNIDYLELPGKLYENMRDNFIGPINLAQICSVLNIQHIYLGTGCIFTYTNEKKIFTENDKPNFFGSSYSIMKGYTDQEIKNYSNTLNLRIRMPISYESNERNFIDKIVNYKNICSISNSMTVLEDMFPIIKTMIINRITGTYNLTNPGTIEHNEILEMYKKYINPEHTWNNITYNEQMNFLKSERSNNELDCSKLINFCQKYDLELKNIKDSVQKLFETVSK
jgi:3,5-epimerase/4-reductase